MFENSKNTRNNTAGVDVANELTTETHLRELRDGIERSATLHIEFWS